MKKTTRKLLLCLSSSTRDNSQIPSDAMAMICPELSYSGQISLIRLLQERGWILSLQHPDKRSTLSLTTLGRAALEREFPVLSTAKHDESKVWTAILFCQSSKQDPQFRNLRRTVLEAGAVSVSRGMYLFAGSLPPRVEEVVVKLYKQQVSVFVISQWLFGKDPGNLFSDSGLTQVISAYSGVSKELDELLNIYDSEKSLNNKRMKQISTLIDRTLAALLEDSPLVRRFFPDSITIHSLVPKIQHLLQTNPHASML